MNHFPICKKVFFTKLLLSCFLCFLSCSEDNKPTDIQDNLGGEQKITCNVSLENENINAALEECKVLSCIDETYLSNGSFTISVPKNGLSQAIVILLEDNPILMARINAKSTSHLTISEKSTALALVMFNPIFASLKNDDYDEFCKIITSSSKFDPYYNEVKKCINNGSDLLDPQNIGLISSLENLLDDVLKNIDTTPFEEVDYSSSFDLPELSSSHSRSEVQHQKIYPLYASTIGNRVILRATNLTPSYYGEVYYGDQLIYDNVRIPTANDWGIFEWLTQNIMRYGDEVSLPLGQEGEYKFHFSRVNEEATRDFYGHLLISFASMLGLDLMQQSTFNIIVDRIVINSTARFGSLQEIAHSPHISVCDIMNVVADCVIKTYQEQTEQNVVKTVSVELSRLFRRLNEFYNIIKGSSNIIDRIAYAIHCKPELDFRLCYYSKEISICSEAQLINAGGNNQVGRAFEPLAKPLRVYVQLYGDDETYKEPSPYFRVRFTINDFKGGYVTNELARIDQNYIAQTSWYLGEGKSQVVTVELFDLLTNTVISEPIYFTATVSETGLTGNWVGYFDDVKVTLTFINDQQVFVKQVALDCGETTSAYATYIITDNTSFKVYLGSAFGYPDNEPVFGTFSPGGDSFTLLFRKGYDDTNVHKIVFSKLQ